MAAKDTDKFLKDMFSFMEREYKRGALDKFVTIVTMTNKDIGQGLKQGYETVRERRGDDNKSIEITDAEFDEIGGACLDHVYRTWASPEVTSRGTSIEWIEGQKLVYRASRDIKKPYALLKKKGTDLISEKLVQAGKKALKGAGGIDKATGKKIRARNSEIGLVKSTVHRAHQGVTTVGSAQISAGLQFLERSRGFGGFVASLEGTDLGNIIRKIQITFTTTGTKSGSKLSKVELNEDMHIAISVLPQNDNASGAEDYDFRNLKRDLEPAIRKYIADQPIGTMSGSDSIEEDAIKRIEYAILKELTDPKNAKLAASLKKPAGRKKKNRNKETSYKVKKTRGTGKKSKQASKTARNPRLKQSNINLAQLMSLVNAKITGTVVKNMGAPALTNRTGRFASSVRVTDVSLTPQGFPSVGYTYRKNPYQTFERGFSQGSPELDPRTLIDKSIREIAINMALGRLYTRRQ